jgi:alpha-L-fucosidase
VSDAGLKAVTHIYNHNAATHKGKNQAVVTGKILTDEQKKALVWDVERGAPNEMIPTTWQTCNCLGNWHYNDNYYKYDLYKSAATVVKLLVDVVSKNGNFLLNVPLRSDGTPDEKEIAILKELGAWMKVNGESIYSTTPWRVFGEGPIANADIKLKNQGFNDEQYTNAGADEIRFTQTKSNLYVTALSWPADGEAVKVKSLAADNELYPKKIKSITLLGYGKVKFSRTAEALTIYLPDKKPNNIAPVFRIAK